MGILNGNSRQYALDNGLVVALQDNPQTSTFSGLLQVNFGFFQEQAGEEGLAHFLEHAVVNGGSERFSPSETEYVIRTIGNFGPRTNLGKTRYSFSNLSENLDSTLDFISSMVFHPIFDESKVEGERKRILREMFDKRSNPNYKRDREFYTRFYRKSPLVLEGDGTIESVSLAPIDLLRQLHQRVYSPTNSDLVIAGNLPEDIDQIIEKYFGKLKSGTDLRVKSYPALEPLSERIFYHWKEPLLCSKEHPEESSAEVTVYLVVPPESCPEFSALKILSYSLGGSSNSRLMKALGLEKGLAYRILSQYDGDYNAGVFMIDGYVPAKRLDEAIDAIFKELRTLRKNPISERDLEIFKSTLRLELAEHFESNRGHVLALVDRLETGATPDYYLDEYSKLTIDQIREVAEQYLPDLRDDKNYALLISDPLKQE